MDRPLKRSNQPFFWMLFGAGGMLSALVGAMLVFITGVAVPLGWFAPGNPLAYDRMHAFASGWIGKAILFGVIVLFLWHAAHRIYHTLHDFGVPEGRPAWWACYGLAIAGTVAAAYRLLSIG